MRKMFVLLAIGAFMVAGQASAAPLVASSLSFQLSALPGASFTGVGATGTATSNLSASLNAGTAIAGVFTTSIPTSAAPPLTAIQIFVTKNAGQTFVPNPTDLGGNLLFSGTANVYGIGGFTTGGGPLLAIPLNLGTPQHGLQGLRRRGDHGDRRGLDGWHGLRSWREDDHPDEQRDEPGRDCYRHGRERSDAGRCRHAGAGESDQGR